MGLVFPRSFCMRETSISVNSCRRRNGRVRNRQADEEAADVLGSLLTTANSSGNGMESEKEKEREGK